jgi:hypothetical protein
MTHNEREIRDPKVAGVNHAAHDQTRYIGLVLTDINYKQRLGRDNDTACAWILEISSSSTGFWKEKPSSKK